MNFEVDKRIFLKNYKFKWFKVFGQDCVFKSTQILGRYAHITIKNIIFLIVVHKRGKTITRVML